MKTWAARLRRRQESITKYTSDHRPTATPQTITDTQLNTTHTPTEGTTPMTNNREIALQHAVAANPSGTPAQHATAAAEYLRFLDSGTAAAPATPAPAPRTGAEILQLIRLKQLTYGRVVSADLLRRAEVLRNQPLTSAVQTALGALRGANEYPAAVVTDLTAALQRLTSGSAPATTPAATSTQGGEQVVNLLRRYEGRYGEHITQLLAEAARRGFGQLSLVEAKRLAVQVLADNYEYRFPTEARELIRQVNAL